MTKSWNTHRKCNFTNNEPTIVCLSIVHLMAECGFINYWADRYSQTDRRFSTAIICFVSAELSSDVLDNRYTVYYITTNQFSSISPYTRNLKRCWLNTIWNCFTHLILQSLFKYYFPNMTMFFEISC